jgi:hypothetical protein
VNMALSLFHPEGPQGHSAVLSSCRTWRYALERRWGSGPFVMFIGLNPSTADETVDDPTIRRCIRFGKDWRMGGLLMTNLFAYRATDPAELSRAEDPIGPDADVWLTTCSMRSALVVAAWGAHPFALRRVADVLAVVGNVYALGLTKDGHPRHPLYMPASAKPFAYNATAPHPKARR